MWYLYLRHSTYITKHTLSVGILKYRHDRLSDQFFDFSKIISNTFFFWLWLTGGLLPLELVLGPVVGVGGEAAQVPDVGEVLRLHIIGRVHSLRPHLQFLLKSTIWQTIWNAYTNGMGKCDYLPFFDWNPCFPECPAVVPWLCWIRLLLCYAPLKP